MITHFGLDKDLDIACYRISKHLMDIRNIKRVIKQWPWLYNKHARYDDIISAPPGWDHPFCITRTSGERIGERILGYEPYFMGMDTLSELVTWCARRHLLFHVDGGSPRFPGATCAVHIYRDNEHVTHSSPKALRKWVLSIERAIP